MFKVDIQNKQLAELKPVGFAELKLRERFDIQEWIEKSPSILGEELLVVGKEVTLASGKRLDLLCLDKEGALVIVELKRDDSGSSVEWQAIKYASYFSNYLPEQVAEQYASYAKSDISSATSALESFLDVDFDAVNSRQRIILVSREFNSEVISAVLWLLDFQIDIQCTKLSPYMDSDGDLFIKPEIIIPLPEAKDYIEKKGIKQRKSVESASEWTGAWFVNVGEGANRTWEDNTKFGFIGAGQGPKYSSALHRLSVGDRIYAYMKSHGYVGFGEVTAPAVMIRDFVDRATGKPLLEAGLVAERPHENCEDEQFSEWVVGVRWLKTVPKSQARTFNGVFANQNVVCKLRHGPTVEFVQREFGA